MSLIIYLDNPEDIEDRKSFDKFLNQEFNIMWELYPRKSRKKDSFNELKKHYIHCSNGGKYNYYSVIEPIYLLENLLHSFIDFWCLQETPTNLIPTFKEWIETLKWDGDGNLIIKRGNRNGK